MTVYTCTTKTCPAKDKEVRSKLLPREHHSLMGAYKLCLFCQRMLNWVRDEV